MRSTTKGGGRQGMAGEEEQETTRECDVQYTDMQHI